MSAARLARLARESGGPQTVAAPAPERCDLCGEPVPERHRHLVEVRSRRMLCACRACTLLLDRRETGGAQLKMVPERRRALPGFALSDADWEALAIPVGVAFFFHSTPAERVVAFYPSPMGATESLLELDAWERLAQANPQLGSLEPDVEALLVCRARGMREHWIVPIDDCYALVGTIRSGWKGFGGGPDVWEAIGAFFEDLSRREESR